MKTKVQDLTIQQLNHLAAIGQGWVSHYSADESELLAFQMKEPNTLGMRYIAPDDYDPCNNGGQAMELVKRFGVCPTQIGANEWSATIATEGFSFNPAETPELAIVRAFVAFKFSDAVDYEAIVGS